MRSIPFLLVLGILFVGCGEEGPIDSASSALTFKGMYGSNYVTTIQMDYSVVPDCSGAPFQANMPSQGNLFSMHTKKKDGKIIVTDIKKVGVGAMCLLVDPMNPFAPVKSYTMITIGGKKLVGVGTCNFWGEVAPNTGVMTSSCSIPLTSHPGVVTTNGFHNLMGFPVPGIPNAQSTWVMSFY